MDQDKNGGITVVEIDAGMKEFLESRNNTKAEGKKKVSFPVSVTK